MDSVEIAERYQQLVDELRDGAVNPEHIEMQVLDVLCDEILKEIGVVDNCDKIKKGMISMYILGCVIGDK